LAVNLLGQLKSTEVAGQNEVKICNLIFTHLFTRCPISDPTLLPLKRGACHLYRLSRNCHTVYFKICKELTDTLMWPFAIMFL